MNEITYAERIAHSNRLFNRPNQSPQTVHQNIATNSSDDLKKNQSYELGNMNHRERLNRRPVFLYPDQRLDRDLTRPNFSDSENINVTSEGHSDGQAGCSQNWQGKGDLII